MVNKTNVQTMIDAFIRLDRAPLLEHPNKGFNMSDYMFSPQAYTQHECGTAACLIGWAKIIFPKYGCIVNLELDEEVNNALTCPSTRTGCKYHYAGDAEIFTLRAAIRVLEILRDTGKVDWNEAIANPWSPEDDMPAQPTDWAKVLLNPTLDIPLLEGPKREQKQYSLSSSQSEGTK